MEKTDNLFVVLIAFKLCVYVHTCNGGREICCSFLLQCFLGTVFSASAVYILIRNSYQAATYAFL